MSRGSILLVVFFALSEVSSADQVAVPAGTYCSTSTKTKINFVSDVTLFVCEKGVCEDSERPRRFTAERNGQIRIEGFEGQEAEYRRNKLFWRKEELTQEDCHSAFHNVFAFLPKDDTPIRLPSLNISRGSVVTAGCSHAGDFASQFHIAFSSLVSASCVFSGQPYHCAVTRFSRDYLVPQNNATGVPNCDGCPDGETLLYDHCKNHPEYVDVGQLVDYPRRACGQNPITKNPCIDDPKNLLGLQA